ncbi:hypothetical protein ACQKFX_29220 [Cupriavidus metallidurans]|uniref:hypothetical protein n=1 Tax=Cupriavidus metallidurans TaxID=119219 RepID=UPI003CFEEFE9
MPHEEGKAIDELYVVEWSKSQCALHIQALKDSVRAARLRFANDEPPPNDYTIIYVGDEEGAHEVARQLRPTVAARYDAVKASQASR